MQVFNKNKNKTMRTLSSQFGWRYYKDKPARAIAERWEAIIGLAIILAFMAIAGTIDACALYNQCPF